MRLLITSTVGRRDEEDEENGNLLLIFVNIKAYVRLYIMFRSVWYVVHVSRSLLTKVLIPGQGEYV
jgi:hypothetical protein